MRNSARWPRRFPALVLLRFVFGLRKTLNDCSAEEETVGVTLKMTTTLPKFQRAKRSYSIYFFIYFFSAYFTIVAQNTSKHQRILQIFWANPLRKYWQIELFILKVKVEFCNFISLIHHFMNKWLRFKICFTTAWKYAILLKRRESCYLSIIKLLLNIT